MKRRVYVLVRTNWYYNDEETVKGCEEAILAFSSPDQAEDFRRQCEEAEQDGGYSEDSNHFEVVEMEVEMERASPVA